MSIELMWAHAKRHVPKIGLKFSECFGEVKNMYDFSQTRSIAMLITQIKQGWNGHSWTDEDTGPCEHKPVDAELCQKYINHCIHELETWIRNSGPAGSPYHPQSFTDLRSTFFFLKNMNVTLSSMVGRKIREVITHSCWCSIESELRG